MSQDDIIPNLLVMPPGSDLHKHPLVLNGSLLLQVIFLLFISGIYHNCLHDGLQWLHLFNLLGFCCMLVEMSETRSYFKTQFFCPKSKYHDLTFTDWEVSSFGQGKASCIPAHVLAPKAGWQVSCQHSKEFIQFSQCLPHVT